MVLLPAVVLLRLAFCDDGPIHTFTDGPIPSHPIHLTLVRHSCMPCRANTGQGSLARQKPRSCSHCIMHLHLSYARTASGLRQPTAILSSTLHATCSSLSTSADAHSACNSKAMHKRTFSELAKDQGVAGAITTGHASGMEDAVTVASDTTAQAAVLAVETVAVKRHAATTQAHNPAALVAPLADTKQTAAEAPCLASPDLSPPNLLPAPVPSPVYKAVESAAIVKPRDEVALAVPPSSSPTSVALESAAVVEPINEVALAIPPPNKPLRARVEHFMVPQDGALLSTLSTLLGADQAFVERLVWFGAVYYCQVMPLPGGGKGGIIPQHLEAGSQGAARLVQQRQLGLSRWGAGTDKSTPKRVTDAHMDVHRGGYLRAHVHPKRFPALYQIRDWHSRILHVTPHFIAVDKPAGVQVPPTVDNIRESLLSKIEEVLDVPPGTLTPPHRLDAGTSGVVLLSRTLEFSRHFQSLLRDKTNKNASRSSRSTKGHGSQQRANDDATLSSSVVAEETSVVRKTYRCITHVADGPPSVGHMHHWVQQNVRELGLPEYTRVVDGPQSCPAAKHCELIIQQVEKVQLVGEAAALWGCEAYECTIQLVTGRTHQIRVQLAAAGHPLCGDVLYKHLAASWGIVSQHTSSIPAPDDVGNTQQNHARAPAQKGDALQGDLAATADTSGQAEAEGTAAASAAADSVSAVTSAAASNIALLEQISAINPIGLQAWQMEVPGDDTYFDTHMRFTAGDPWWRASSPSTAQ